MDGEVKPHWTLKDILNAWAGNHGKTLAAALGLMSEERRVELLNRMLDTYLGDVNDEQTPLMLDALDRVVMQNDKPRLLVQMEHLYWNIPSKMRRTRLWIVRKLLVEWTCDIKDPASVHAFRRFIAMVFPEPIIKSRREGETDMEMNARGQEVVRADQQAALEAARERLESASFLHDDFLRSNADAIYEPWLQQPWIPAELSSVLIVARAKHGGLAVAERDLRNAKVLEGLPDSGIAVIGGITSRMRINSVQAEAVLEDIVRRTRVRNPAYDAQTNMKRHYEFIGTDCIEIGVRAHGEHDLSDLYADSIMAIEDARRQGTLLTCNTKLTVYISLGGQLQQQWSKAS